MGKDIYALRKELHAALNQKRSVTLYMAQEESLWKKGKREEAFQVLSKLLDDYKKDSGKDQQKDNAFYSFIETRAKMREQEIGKSSPILRAEYEAIKKDARSRRTGRPVYGK